MYVINANFKNHLTLIYVILNFVGGAVALWLVHWTLDQTVRVRASAGVLCCVLRQDTLHSQCVSSPRCINGYRRIYCWGVTL